MDTLCTLSMYRQTQDEKQEIRKSVSYKERNYQRISYIRTENMKRNCNIN